ncbi:MAG: FMN-binding protein, partial [Lachnospiraceae bacterium]|nr:FMN-binding protein [Lachnospiraceae bacterium]
MTQKQKTYVGAGVMAVLSAGVIFSAEPLYEGISQYVKGSQSFTPGTYVGAADGFGGDVIAKVTVTADGIEAVELIGDGETPELGGEALKTLAPKFVEAGSAVVDGVSGCTITSSAAMKAVQQALDQASGKIEVIDPNTILTEKAPEETQKAEETKKPEEAAGAEAVYNGGLRTGMATVHSLKKSKDAGEKDGNAQVDSVVAAVVIDQKGRVVACKLDTA